MAGKESELTKLIATAKEDNIVIKNLQNQLADEYSSLNDKHKDIQEAKDKHLAAVARKEKELQDRETAVAKIASLHKVKEIEFTKREKENKELEARFIEEHNAAGKEKQAAILNAESAEQLMVEVKEIFAKAKEEALKAESLRQEALDKTADVREMLEETRKNKKEVSDKLAEIMKQKESINDIIIDSKREKLEAVNLTKAAQKNIVEANQKIAELKELKEAMAKQEKPDEIK